MNWIVRCLTSTSFVVVNNGSSSSLFQASRGFRKGCPLSPFTFILVIKGLSILRSDAKRGRLIKHIRIVGSINITHLLLIDDIMLIKLGTFFKNI